jgi:drug/metabolite transporter (DMT)-like permease
VRAGAPRLREASPLLRRSVAAALVGVAAVWGFTFPVVKTAVERMPPMEFLALRFSIAGAVLMVALWPAVRGLGRDGVLAGVAAGAVLFAGYAFQTVGLQYTEATNAGFVTGLFVVVTPVLSAAVLGRTPGRGALLGVALATAGLFLLSVTDGFRPRSGDLIVLGAAASFAVHFVLLGRFSPVHHPGGLTAVQMVSAAAIALGVGVASEDLVAPAGGYLWFAILVSALVSSALGFFVQTLAQRYLSPTRTALILVSEPAFAGLAGFLLLGEVLSGRGWTGAGLILAGMVVAELSPQRSTTEG